MFSLIFLSFLLDAYHQSCFFRAGVWEGIFLIIRPDAWLLFRGLFLPIVML
jgi:hypothetical protein